MLIKSVVKSALLMLFMFLTTHINCQENLDSEHLYVGVLQDNDNLCEASGLNDYCIDIEVGANPESLSLNANLGESPEVENTNSNIQLDDILSEPIEAKGRMGIEGNSERDSNAISKSLFDAGKHESGDVNTEDEPMDRDSNVSACILVNGPGPPPSTSTAAPGSESTDSQATTPASSIVEVTSSTSSTETQVSNSLPSQGGDSSGPGSVGSEETTSTTTSPTTLTTESETTQTTSTTTVNPGLIVGGVFGGVGGLAGLGVVAGLGAESRKRKKKRTRTNVIKRRFVVEEVKQTRSSLRGSDLSGKNTRVYATQLPVDIQTPNDNTNYAAMLLAIPSLNAINSESQVAPVDIGTVPEVENQDIPGFRVRGQECYSVSDSSFFGN